MARCFRQEGANLVLIDRNLAALEALAGALGGATTVVCDQRIDNEIEAAAAASGSVDVFVNNAGIIIRKPLPQTSFSEISQLVDVNAAGSIKMAIAIARGMAVRGAGTILNVSSQHAFIGGLSRHLRGNEGGDCAVHAHGGSRVGAARHPRRRRRARASRVANDGGGYAVRKLPAGSHRAHADRPLLSTSEISELIVQLCSPAMACVVGHTIVADRRLAVLRPFLIQDGEWDVGFAAAGARYPRVFRPFQIGNVEIRTASLFPRTTNFAEKFLPTKRHVAYHRARGGGVGLIFVEPLRVHRTALGRAGGLAGADPQALPGLRQSSPRSARRAPEPSFRSRRRPAQRQFRRSAAAVGAVFNTLDHKRRDSARDDYREMEEVMAGYVATARFAVEAGFEGMEVHFGHGHLLHQFLSPACNVRTDGHGGSLDNRLRYPLAVLRLCWPRWQAACRSGFA